MGCSLQICCRIFRTCRNVNFRLCCFGPALSPNRLARPQAAARCGARPRDEPAGAARPEALLTPRPAPRRRTDAGGMEICNAFVRFSRGGAGSLAGCRAGARRVVRRCRRHVLGGAAPGDRGDRPRLSDQEPGRPDRGPRSREGETQQRCAGSAGDGAGRAAAGDLRGPERPGRGQSEGRCHAGRVLRLSLPVLQAGRAGDRRAARRGQEAARRLQGISGARPRIRPPPRGPRWRRRSRENTRRCTAR